MIVIVLTLVMLLKEVVKEMTLVRVLTVLTFLKCRVVVEVVKVLIIMTVVTNRFRVARVMPVVTKGREG